MPKSVIQSSLPFPYWEAVTPVAIYQTEDTEDSGPINTLIYEGNAIYSEKSSQRFDAQNHLIQLVGTLIIEGEVMMHQQIEFAGYASIKGQKVGIDTCSKNRLLGAVYSTEFTLK